MMERFLMSKRKRKREREKGRERKRLVCIRGGVRVKGRKEGGRKGKRRREWAAITVGHVSQSIIKRQGHCELY